jgi:uncharacterized glyoxalase superfamily protein PhnB
MPESCPVIPVIVCADIAATHDYLVDVFGFKPGGVQRDGEGRPVHGEVRMGASRIWLHAVSDASEMAAPEAGRPSTGGTVVYVDDVDAHHDRAQAAGARIDSRPTDQEYGQREYRVRDPEGHRWWFATPLR